MTSRVDINCDMGESFGAYRIGADDEVFPFITSANVACGFHGGDPAVMRTTIAKAREARRRRRRASRISGSHRVWAAEHGRHAGRGVRPRRLSGRRAPRLRARGRRGDAAREGARRAVQHGGRHSAARRRDCSRGARRGRVARCCSGCRAAISSPKVSARDCERRAKRSRIGTTCRTDRSSHASATMRTCTTRMKRCSGRSAWCVRGRCARRREGHRDARRHDLHPRRRAARCRVCAAVAQRV